MKEREGTYSKSYTCSLTLTNIDTQRKKRKGETKECAACTKNKG